MGPPHGPPMGLLIAALPLPPPRVQIKRQKGDMCDVMHRGTKWVLLTQRTVGIRELFFSVQMFIYESNDLFHIDSLYIL